MIITPKVVFIGDKEIANFLNKENGAFSKLGWELLAIANTPDDLYEMMQDGSIQTDDINIILTTDTLYTNLPDEFIGLLAFYAPYYMIGIFSYSPSLEAEIIEKAENASIQQGQGSAPIYFLETSAPAKRLQDAKVKYIQSPESDPYNVRVLAGYDINDDEEEEYGVDYSNAIEENPTNNDGNDYLGKVIAVTSSKGGSGKSTVTVDTATYLAYSSEQSVKEGLEKRPLKIIIIDLDTRDGQIGFLIGEKSPTVLHILNEGISQTSIDEATIYNNRLKIHAILAPKKPRHADNIPPELYQDLIKNLKTQYDYIFLDTSVNYLDPLLEKVAYPMADNIIFITDIVINSIYSMVRWIQEVTMPKSSNGMGIPRGKIGIVVNKYIKDVIQKDLLTKASQNIQILSLIPNQAKTLAHATNLNQMQISLKNQLIKESVGYIAKAITGKNYQLSDNLDIN